MQSKNLIFPSACRHILRNELSEIERLEMEMHLVTVDPPEDFRYGKGPDTVRLCAMCSGKLLGILMKEGILDRLAGSEILEP